MSRILRRPMFRGGGKVSSYGNGIASGMGYAGGGTIGGGYIQGQRMADGRYGFADPYPIGSTRSQIDAGRQAINQMYNVPDDGEFKTGKKILEKAKGIRRFIPTKSGILNTLSKGAKLPIVGAAGTYGGAAGIGMGIGQLADFYAKSTYTPEGYRRLKEMGGPQMTFDETNIDVGQDLDYIAQGNMIGEKPGFFPRGGKKKFYEDQGYNPDGTLKKIIEDQTTKDPALEAAEENPNKEITVDTKTGDPVLTKKERLDKKAKEYEELLGAGIKRDSIFDAMIEGGTRLYEGEGAASAIRAANKALDPIQNIKTASRKLALEEDIAIRKALALDKTKRTATSDMIALGKASGKSDAEIYRDLIKNKEDSKADYIKASGGNTTTGLTLWAKDNIPDLKSLVDKKTDPATLEDGKHYIPELFTVITIKDKVIVDKERLR